MDTNPGLWCLRPILPGQRVVAMTGEVVTTRAGRLRLQQPFDVTSHSNDFPKARAITLHLSPGDVVYVVHYSGEGLFVGWYGRQVLDDVDGSDFGAAVVEESSPETEWWARVRNARGQFGWVRAERSFSNQDACG